MVELVNMLKICKACCHQCDASAKVYLVFAENVTQSEISSTD